MKKYISFLTITLSMVLFTPVFAKNIKDAKDTKALEKPAEPDSKKLLVGCSTSCTFSNCSITCDIAPGGGGGAACGCYFGIACCNCGNSSPTHTINVTNITAGITYLGGLDNSHDFDGVVTVLREFYDGMDNAAYDSAVSDYKAEVGKLSSDDQTILQSWVDANAPQG